MCCIIKEIRMLFLRKSQNRHELTQKLQDEFTQLCDNQLENIHKGNVDDYEYIFKQILPWYKRFEKWLKRI